MLLCRVPRVREVRQLLCLAAQCQIQVILAHVIDAEVIGIALACTVHIFQCHVYVVLDLRLLRLHVALRQRIMKWGAVPHLHAW